MAMESLLFSGPRERSRAFVAAVAFGRETDNKARCPLSAPCLSSPSAVARLRSRHGPRTVPTVLRRPPSHRTRVTGPGSQFQPRRLRGP
ncbi:hypothetical protein Mp_8g17410 [Marchantia polymorpha subsp. ruderalis]|uniref:Uncharacterized protein n=1 Tax=Marchantia polymorpha TaxID=3197 RepID=A0A2R6X8B6_MARPO|nr:hypothetical protein MARPO_0030s0075 [Marchantia polymorpha]BBN20220.1 hypothetical protein Mp_8g17410 [Marchantia polymorpha subsp. ruderalis]|eukprot:PTQ42338.1 hypothetical protein MARPO_0030s0075 [Marchantia polymorpha]